MDSTTNLVSNYYGFQLPEINFLLIGPSGCGKTTFLERITTGTIGSNEFRVPHTPYVLQNKAQEGAPLLNFYESDILDINSKPMRPDVVVYCFDIGAPGGVQELGELNKDAHIKYGADLVCIILGLKRDLRNGLKEGEYVDPFEGVKTAQILECTGYMECSALTEELIPAVVEDLVKKGLDVKGGKTLGDNPEQGLGTCLVM